MLANHENTSFFTGLCDGCFCAGPSKSSISLPENLSRQWANRSRRTGGNPDRGRYPSGSPDSRWRSRELPRPSCGVRTQHSSRIPRRPTRLVPLIKFMTVSRHEQHSLSFSSGFRVGISPTCHPLFARGRAAGVGVTSCALMRTGRSSGGLIATLPRGTIAMADTGGCRCRLTSRRLGTDAFEIRSHRPPLDWQIAGTSHKNSLRESIASQ